MLGHMSEPCAKKMYIKDPLNTCDSIQNNINANTRDGEHSTSIEVKLASLLKWGSW